MLRHPQPPAQLGNWLVGQKGASGVKMLEQKGTGSLQALKAVRGSPDTNPTPLPKCRISSFYKMFPFFSMP